MTQSDPLARRLAAGNLDAPRQLVERHHAELYRYALALLRDASAAEDVVQDAFERAFAALGKYSEDRIKALSVRAWLYRITLNVVRNAWRERSREIPAAETPERADASCRGVRTHGRASSPRGPLLRSPGIGPTSR